MNLHLSAPLRLYLLLTLACLIPLALLWSGQLAASLVTGLLLPWPMARWLSRTVCTPSEMDNIIQSMGDPLLVVEGATIRMANRAAREMFGYPSDELVGKPLSHILSVTPPTGDGVDERQCEGIALCRDGRNLAVMVMHTPLEDHENTEILVLRDISQRLHVELALRQAKEASDEATRLKSVFLANMSHEIRTPLNAVIGMTDLALATALTKEQRQYLEIVLNSGQALLALINDILDFSKIEANRLDLEDIPFSLLEVVEGACETVAVRAHQNNLTLVNDMAEDVPIWVRGDPTRLRQILVNLLANAIKFTRYGEIVLRVEPFQSEHAEGESVPEAGPGRQVLHFTIQDTGIGIAPERQQAIFESFTQANAATHRQFGGTGLGLTISRNLVRMMGGTMWVRSAGVDQGSTFHFTVSVGFTEHVDLIDHLRQDCSLEGLRILLAEEHPVASTVLARLLTQCGALVYPIHAALEVGKVLLEAKSEERPFHLLLLSCHLPGMSEAGLDRAMDALATDKPKILILLNTGHRRYDMPWCARLDVYQSLIKPVRREELARLIHGAMGKPTHADPTNDSRPAWVFSKPIKALVVDDTLFHRELAQKILTSAGHQVVLANDGVEALAAVKRERFDIILMDVQMPELNGVETTRQIRQGLAGEDAARTPILAVTANAIVEDRQRCLDAGMDGFLAKPFLVRQFMASIWHLVEGQVKLCPVPVAKPITEEPPLFDLEQEDPITEEQRQRFLVRIHALMTDVEQRLEEGQWQGVEPRVQEIRQQAVITHAIRLQHLSMRVLLDCRKQKPSLERIRDGVAQMRACLRQMAEKS